MPMVSLSTDETAKARFAQLCEGACLARNEALGILVQFWGETRRLGLEHARLLDLQKLLPLAPVQANEVMRALLLAGYVEGGAVGDDVVHVVDNNGLTQRTAKRRADGSAAGRRGQQQAASRAAPKGHAAEGAQSKALTQKARPGVKTPLELASRDTWQAYEAAYTARMGQAPTRNAKTNALIKQFVQRLGHDDAPQVIAFYVQHPNAYYMQRLYMLDLAVRDAEALRTQWANGRFITADEVGSAEQAHALATQRQRILSGEI